LQKVIPAFKYLYVYDKEHSLIGQIYESNVSHFHFNIANKSITNIGKKKRFPSFAIRKLDI